LGNKSTKQLGEEYDALVIKQKEEWKEALPANRWTRAPFLVAFNVACLVGLVKGGRKWLNFNIWLSKFIPHTYSSGIFFSLIQSSAAFSIFVTANGFLYGMSVSQMVKFKTAQNRELRKIEAQFSWSQILDKSMEEMYDVFYCSVKDEAESDKDNQPEIQ
jgi:hypothetical protein